MRISLNGEEKDIEAVLFDMDNTFFDFVEAKTKACREVVEYLGKDDPQELFDYFLRNGSGFEDLKCISNYLKDRKIFDKKTYDECCKIYEDTKLESIELYEGVENVLEFLKKHRLKLAVVSDADKDNLEIRLEHTNLLRFFDVVVSKDETGKPKPDPELLNSALNYLDVPPEKALIVGDSMQRDILAGKRLGMLTAHAKYGDRNIKNSEGVDVEPDIRLAKLKDLKIYFKN